MQEARHKSLEILNSVLDKMLSSDEFRQQAAEYGLAVLDVAILIINASHPRLSLASKHIIHQQMLESIQIETISPAEANGEDTIAEAGSLLSKHSPELSKSAKNRIFDKMMASVPDTDLPSPAKERIFDRVLEAQQQLQIDSLLISDEALAIAKENPDPVIQAAVRLRTAPLPILSAEGKAGIRERIFSEKMEKEPRILRPNFGTSFQRMVASLAILLFISLLVIPQSAADSLPGDALYPVKRGMENVALQVATSDIRRIDLHLNQADERIEELTALMRLAIYNMELLEDAFESLEAAGNLAKGNPTLENVIFQRDVSATYQALDLIMQDYIVTYDIESLQSFITRQNDLIAVLMLNPTDDEDEIEVIEADVIIETEMPETNIIEADRVIVYARLNTGGNVRVRSLPNINAPIVTVIEPGDAVTQISISDDTFWTEVELDDGQVGWIATFLLADSPSVAGTSVTPSNISQNGSGNGASVVNPPTTSTGNTTNPVNNSDSNTNNGNAYGVGNGNAYGVGNGNANGNGNTNGNNNNSNP